MKVIDIAQVCHEANRALQIVQGDPSPSPAWEDAEQWQIDATVESVVNCQAGVTPEQLHEKWCEFKTSTGWIYGPVKDSVLKTHPCLVPYKDLPEEQRVKDSLFKLIVALLS